MDQKHINVFHGDQLVLRVPVGATTRVPVREILAASGVPNCIAIRQENFTFVPSLEVPPGDYHLVQDASRKRKAPDGAEEPVDLATLLVLAAKETEPKLRALLTAEAERRAKRQRREDVTSCSVTIDADAVEDAALYHLLCIDRDVTKEFDESVLPPHDPLLTELRWLWLKHTAGSEPLDSLLGNSEKEVAYHPYLLRFYQAAAHSQPRIEFRPEDKSAGEKSRADIQCFVDGKYCCPSENKKKVVVRESVDVTKPGSVAYAIDGQKDAFGKLLRCMISKGLRSKETKTAHSTTISVRIGAVYYALWEFDGLDVERLRVWPPLPSRPIQPGDREFLCDVSPDRLNRVRAKGNGKLLDLLSPEATPGFALLNRFVARIAQEHSIPLASVQLRKGETTMDLSRARVVACTRTSLLLRLGDSERIIKISDTDSIQREAEVHAVVDMDAPPVIRCMVGRVTLPEFRELAGLELEHYGTPLEEKHVDTPEKQLVFIQQGLQALKHMHSRGVLHRDVKPQNFIVVDGRFLLNDFNVSWKPGYPQEELLSKAGTKRYQAERAAAYSTADDLLGLVLSAVSLFTNAGSGFENPTAILHGLQQQGLDPRVSQALEDVRRMAVRV